MTEVFLGLENKFNRWWSIFSYEKVT